MGKWLKVFKESGLREMIVTDGVTGKLIFKGIKIEKKVK